MYNTIKKLSLGFIFLNLFMFQSLKADMMFYYSAAILPSIAAQGKASPLCPPPTVLNDIDGVYNAIIDNLSFAEQDGRRIFEAELDNTKYIIDETFYINETNISTMSPIYFIFYRDANTTYETSAKLEISQANIESNMTWSYQETRIENNNGVKMSFTEAEGGSWNFETDSTTTLSVESTPVVNVKPVRAITTNEINNILENAGIHITLEVGDTAQLNIEKVLNDGYWWADKSYIPATFETLGDVIAAAKYNSSNPFASIVLWGDRGNEGVGITFAANSTGTSGTLVEVSNDNKLLSANAGTWSIETITDDGNTYDVIVLNPILCGYGQGLGKLDANGYIIQGEHSEVAGEITAQIAFSESLQEKLKAYFVDNAILDVTPPMPITEAMLSGKTFYSTDSNEYGYAYASMTESSPGILTRHEIWYNTDGSLQSDMSFSMPYILVNGILRVDLSGLGGGYMWATLISETPDQWNVILEEDLEMDGLNGINTRSEIWLTSKPSNFPAEFPSTTPIDESMLAGKTFYVANYYEDNSGADFEKIEVLSSSQVQYTEVLVDGLGGIIASNTGTVNYLLYNGSIVMNLGGTMTIFSLISSTVDQWNMFKQDNFGTPDYNRTWLLSEPAGFPLLP